MVLALVFALAGLLVSLVVNPLLIAKARDGFGVDQPDGLRKTHIQGISRLGGISMTLVFGLVSVFVISQGHSKPMLWIPALAGPLGMFLLGLVDDFKPLGAKVKLGGQITIALLVYGWGLRIVSMTYPGGSFSFDLTRWSFLITIFWLIAIPNLINLIDGADGLAGGLGAFLFLTLGVVAIQSQQWGVVWISMAMVGALIGFLFFNFPPAKIFLGDGGAYLMGSAISTLSLVSSNKGSIAAALLVTVVALGIPIADTLFALFRRFIKGYPLFHADAGHIHHRLQKIGFSKRRMVLGMYVVFLILGLFGLSIFWSQGRTLPIVGGFLVLSAVFAVKNLGYVHSWTHFRLKIDLALHRRSQVRYALLGAELLELEVDRAKDFAEFQVLLRQILKGVGFDLKGIHSHSVSIVLENGEGLFLGISEREEKEHWENLAGLFRPALNHALKKWPHGKFDD
jgi:UDP-GlcNAc:undecaprenyl-phosphate GlcNAc-1-phosphate transferase